MSERESFAEYYGVYTEMVYIICNGDIMKSDEVFKMNVHKFLFWAEYLLRKRRVENIK